MLIYFGRTYRDSNVVSDINAEDYPPMDYMIDEYEVDTIEDEKEYLKKFRS